MDKVTFDVQNISCGHCVNTIEMELGEQKGVENVTADQKSKQVKVSFQSPATEESLRELLADINYPAS